VLLHKPNLPTLYFEAGSADHPKKSTDMFKPPYNPNPYVGELKDEKQSDGYVVLVSAQTDSGLVLDLQHTQYMETIEHKKF